MNVSGISSSAGFYASASSRGQNAAESPAKTPGAAGQQALTADEQKQVAQLKARDRAVRQHEQAHMAAGAGLITSGASFTYQKGPDGVNYAVGGEVGISTSPGRTPDETIDRARRIKAAALAPADPSSQDRAVAAKAGQMEQGARMELAQATTASGQEEASGGRAAAVAQAYAAPTGSRSTGFSAYA
ncbi:MAG: hypothetical protein H6R14_1950 [Proteobacteria bacterium]|nr:hypothetical protein [Pseudomonadota bacterium]